MGEVCLKNKEEEQGLASFSLQTMPSKPMMLRLRKRSQFLAVQGGEKRRGRYFLLEVRQRSSCGVKERQLLPRIGFTVSRKNGNAVLRNRIRRRLREAVRIGVVDCLVSNYDYVIVARPDILTVPFAVLVAEIRRRVKMR